ncbi:MAG: tetratricopeptide repeat protein [Chloroflexi bacterium]|nr:tetratricopeptide repeat protein [Chloroflexota bacterium]
MTTEQEKEQQAYQLLREGARLLRSQRFAEALPPLEQANELKPHDADIAISLGGAYVMNGKWSKAVTLLENAAERYPGNVRLWLNLAAAYLGRLELSSRPRQEQAIEAYQRALELDPKAPSVQYNIGLVYAERKDWAQAEVWFAQALNADPGDRDAAKWLKKVRDAQKPELEG